MKCFQDGAIDKGPTIYISHSMKGHELTTELISSKGLITLAPFVFSGHFHRILVNCGTKSILNECFFELSIGPSVITAFFFINFP